MGLLSDIVEDNRERVAQIETSTYRPDKRPLTDNIATFICRICDQVFVAEFARDSHISREHAKSHVYIKADGAIVRRDMFFPQRPQSLDLIPHKISEVQVRVKTGKKTKSFRAKDTRDLSPLIPKGYTGEMQVTVNHDRVESQFRLYIGVAPPFENAKLDAEVIALQGSLECGDEPDWTQFQQRQRQLTQNDLEKNYLDGFLEYSLGFHLEKRLQWQECGTHLEPVSKLA